MGSDAVTEADGCDGAGERGDCGVVLVLLNSDKRIPHNTSVPRIMIGISFAELFFGPESIGLAVDLVHVITGSVFGDMFTWRLLVVCFRVLGVRFWLCLKDNQGRNQYHKGNDAQYIVASAPYKAHGSSSSVSFFLSFGYIP